ncbi:peptidase M1-like protein [Tamaricihabitans halophyticus]|uniref:Aminopeptidase N n=1 Tax=Tamaricihabitans halophyticus TaxID=1262583 RepID=A0A4R2QT75_9PSEU|nr:M1 family metallopeptidase [Tamaricihabitans halophyticus]TCP53133.1 peptidase M1-like protein [Tamaricihabitans halophyticus]
MRVRARAATTALATGLAVVLLGSTASATEPGAPGIGDPYYPGSGNGGYDVDYYDLRLTYQPKTDELAGTTTILATSTQPLSSFYLDFALDTSSVRVNNQPAKFAREGEAELRVTPKRPIAKGQPMTITVRYQDVPSTVQVDGFTAWKRLPDGALAVDQPHIASWWYPSNDHPLDKATFDVSVEVPNDVSAISNGRLLDKESKRPGWTRWNWRSTSPQASYLTTLAVGDFEVIEDTTPDGKPLVTAYSRSLDPANARAAKASLGRTVDVTEVLSEYFGPYPFEANGGVVSPGVGFALETQTRPVYDEVFFDDGSSNTYVVAHELAHQWFGDLVSVTGWRDIWVNEGFASYAEFLWSEYLGEGTAAELAGYLYDQYPADDPFWQVKPGDPGPENQFHPAVYDRGAMAVQALRTEIGDAAFFELLRTWPAERANGTGSVHDMIAMAERISGKQLDKLFDTWLFTPGKPPVGPNGSATGSRAAQAEPPAFAKISRNHELLHQN